MAKKVVNKDDNFMKMPKMPKGSKTPIKSISKPKTFIKKTAAPKISVKKEIRPKVSIKKVNPRISNSLDIEKALIENFVSLQKVMTNLSVSFDGLSTRISKLLDLFEFSAKALAEKDFSMNKDNKTEKEIHNKLNSLLDQNKIIARGLTLLHEGEPQMQQPVQQMQPPVVQQPPSKMPPMSQPPTQQRMPMGLNKLVEDGEYKKSITSQE